MFAWCVVFTSNKTMYSLETRRHAKRHAMACVLVVLASQSMAQTAIVGFTGRVVNPTCVSALSGVGVPGNVPLLALPPASASGAARVGDTYGRTAFTLGMGDCAHASPVAPMVSISSNQAVNGHIASGIKNLVIELGVETVTNTQKLSAPMPVVQNPGAGLMPLRAYPENGFYIQYRAVAGDSGSENTTPASPTITVNLIYV